MLDQIKFVSSDSLGVPYFEKLPRIEEDGIDLVEEAIRGGKIRVLNGFRVDCFLGTLEAEIVIEPLKDAAGTVMGATVVLRAAPQCWPYADLMQSQRLINIGKSAISLVHNFRNPLHSIKGAMFYLGNKYSSDPEVAEFTSLADAEIERMESVISGFLDNSSRKILLVTTDLNGIVRKLETLNTLRAKTTKIKFISELGPVPPVSIDYFEIEQAIANIISNAMEAMPNGGVLVASTFSRRLSDKDYVFLEISDSGTGMAGNPIDAGLRDDPGSSSRGYGLSITAEAFRRHGGGFKIIGKQQLGSVVRLWLPAAEGGGKDE
ncbi:MAG: hypothetical protein LLG06_02450 [Desulfobacteraceae bacterium]|nr:hypothetical protein [Desulfobacteraceae bacterium]